MRRWNGWGDSAVSYPVPKTTALLLEQLVGPATPPRDARFEEVVASVPRTRLPAHRLVVATAADRAQHARGQSMPDWIALRSGRIGVFPDGVAYPTAEADVVTLLDYARANDVRLVPYGGGTSVVGHINPLPGDRPVLTVDLGRLNRLQLFDEVSRLATFGAGITGPDLEAQLRARGYILGHFPQSFELSTLGGWIATRSSGQQSLGYGRIERLFAGGRVITPAGLLDLPTWPASAAGPDLRELVLGSEGRLGIITQATVRISPLPEQEDFHAIFFPEFERAVLAARQIVQAGLPLSLLRLSTAVETQTTLALAGHRRLLGALERFLSLRGLDDQKCMLLVGFSGRTGVVKTARRTALDIAAHQGGVHVGRAFGRQWHKGRFMTPYLRNTLWEMGYAVDTVETAIHWTHVPFMLDAIEEGLRGALQEFDERVHVFTHLSHLYPTGASVYTTYLFRIAPDPDETLHRWHLLKAAASEAIVAQGGTISHQHGVGIDHAPYLTAEKGELGLAVLRDTMQRVDPTGIMNPGKLLPEE